MRASMTVRSSSVSDWFPKRLPFQDPRDRARDYCRFLTKIFTSPGVRVET
jgi:hypothetical protein